VEGGGEDAEAVGDAAAEVDGGGLGEVAGGAGDLADGGVEEDGVGEELVVEDEAAVRARLAMNL